MGAVDISNTCSNNNTQYTCIFSILSIVWMVPRNNLLIMLGDYRADSYIILCDCDNYPSHSLTLWVCCILWSVNIRVLLHRRPVGRPRVEVDLDQVEYLRSLRLSWVKIAEVLEVSRHTLYRRMADEGRFFELYSEISDQDLDSAIAGIKREHCNDGEALMSGHLQRIGIIVPRARLRAALHRVDPVGIKARALRTVRRRVYSVDHPNSVWHLDSNHKLIRWRLIVHGAIDGLSRKILYLIAANNNEASTVVGHFSQAVLRNGLPDRVRTDLGGENVDAWRYMIHYHQHDSSCVVTGSSTHNERIERLWRDMTRCVGKLFYDTLYALEENALLDPLNEVDLFCVHYVFIPLMNNCLKQFVESWNFHPLSTEHNMTPEQLFVIGTIDRQASELPSLNSYNWQNVATNDLPVQEPVIVQVPNTNSTICQRLSTELEMVQRNQPSTNFGADMYREVTQRVGNHLLHSCSVCFH